MFACDYICFNVLDGWSQGEVVASGVLPCWYNGAVEQHREESGRRGQSTTHRGDRDGAWKAKGTGILLRNYQYHCMLYNFK